MGEEEEDHVLEIQIVICMYIPSFEADLQGESSGAGAKEFELTNQKTS